MNWTAGDHPRQKGYGAIKAGRLTEALPWLEKALADNGRDVQARSWLGQVLCALGRRTEGTIQLREAGQVLVDETPTNGNIGPILEIVGQLQQWGDFPGALDLGAKAMDINGNEFRGHQLLAASYAQLNKKQEAIAAARRALELAPENGMLQVFVGSLEADAGENESARARLEKALSQSLNAREQFRAHKELARILDRVRQYDAVFPHLHASGNLAKSLPEYSRQDAALLPNLINANKAGFDRELLGRWSGSTFGDRPAPVFLIGFFRSGTTLAQEVLDAHPDVFVADEADFIWAMQQEVHRMDISKATTAEKLHNFDLDAIRRLRESYWKRVEGRYGTTFKSKTFVDKFTLNTIDVGLINCVFPDAKVLFVARDPRDVCLSCFMQLMVPTPATVHLLTWEGTARLYAQVMNWWLHIRQQLRLPFVEFRYEDAVGQFVATYRRVFEFMNLPWDPAVVGFHKHAAEKHITTPSRTQVAQPLYSSSVARWRHYEAEFEPVLGTLQPYIDAFGY